MLSQYKKIQTAFLLLLVVIFQNGVVSANNLTHRSITVGTSVAGAVTTHTIKFDIVTPGTLGSIQLQYCDNDPFVGLPCTTPPGLSVNTGTLSYQTGETGFSIHPSSTANNIILTRTASASSAGQVEYVFTGVTNPSSINNSTYVRISTYSSTDATGLLTDRGGVVFSTAGNFGTNAYVPPFLHFCTGVTVSSNCSSTSGDSVSFGTLKTIQTAHTSTQLAAATNDPDGYVIYTLGSTMTSGNNTISAISSPNPSVAGLSQFGINLRSNTNPSEGNDPSGVGIGTPMPNYTTPNLYMFDSGAAIAQATSYTDYNVYTVTYIANISLDQAPGVYVTTITYLAVGQF